MRPATGVKILVLCRHVLYLRSYQSNAKQRANRFRKHFESVFNKYNNFPHLPFSHRTLMIFWWHQLSVQVMMRTWKSVSQEQVGQPWQQKHMGEQFLSTCRKYTIILHLLQGYRPNAQTAIIRFTFSTLPVLCSCFCSSSLWTLIYSGPVSNSCPHLDCS